MRTETKSFLEYIHSKDKKESNHRYNNINPGEVTDWLLRIDDVSFSRMISDPFWNRYPSFTYSKVDPKSLKRFGIEISQVIRQLIMMNSGNKNNLLIKKSTGFIAQSCMHYFLGKNKVALANRVINTSDVRVRRQAASVVPNKTLKKAMLTEKDSTVLKIIFNRIGYQNIEQQESEKIIQNLSKQSYYAKILISKLLSNMESSKISDLTLKDFENPRLSYYKNSVLESILQKSSNSELLFFLGIISDSSGLPKQVARKRLTGGN